MFRRVTKRPVLALQAPPEDLPDMLPELAIRLEGANFALLDAQMREALGDAITGISYDGTTVRVHFREPYTEAQEDAVEALIAAHDPDASLPAANVIPTLPEDADDATADTVLSVAVERLAEARDLPTAKRMEVHEQALDTALRELQRLGKKTTSAAPETKTTTRKKTAK